METKPPTKTKPSAEAEEAPDELDAEANELDQRLRELTGDYAALFLRYPNVEGRPSVEAYERMRVLAAIRVHPWRKKLAAQALTLERESLKAAGVELRQKEDWWERSWIESIPGTVKRREWDVQAVARDLITTLPASLRLKCPGYPALEDRDAFSAAAVAVASKIRNEVKDSKRCKDPDAIKIGRLALEAMGDKNARNLRLLRPQKD
jgi:hypothetical protein